MKRFFFALFAVGTIASASPVTGQVTQTGVGNGTVQWTNNGGFYVGPYTLSINGGPSVPALCVDFNDETNIGDTWNAYLTNLGSSSLSTTYHPTGKTGYLAASYLFDQITKAGITAQQQIDLQDAAWFIFSPSSIQGDMSQQAMSDYNNAVANASHQNGFAYELISSVDPNHHQQEFIVAAPVPEPASFALLGLGMSGAVLVARLRRKKV